MINLKPRFVIFELPFGGRNEFEPIFGRPEFCTARLRPNDYRGGAQVIILPGSGRTIADLYYLRASGGSSIIQDHLASGGTVVGVCGGYQMLGSTLIDPGCRQGSQMRVEGLGYLPVSTLFGPAMLNSRTTAQLLVGDSAGELVTGEEHRSGYSTCLGNSAQFTALNKVVRRTLLTPAPLPASVLPGAVWRPGSEELDGLVSADRRIWATYLHLIFHNEAFLRSFLTTLT